MAYRVIIANEKIWLKDCSKIPKKIFEKILDTLENLEKEPWGDDLQVKRLKNYQLADFRLRIGGYRVLLDRNLETKQIMVYRVFPRGKLY